MKEININKLEVNPEGEIVKKKHTIKHSKDNALERHEQGELIRAIDKLVRKPETRLRYRVLIALCMEAGLRVSESIQARLSWINDTEDGITLNIPIKDRDLRNLKRDWQPKTSAGMREVIFLSPHTGSMVQTFMVSNPKGLGFSRQRANQIIHEVGALIGRPSLHPHALRSTYANNILYKGINTTTLQYYMGWSDIKTAINYIKTSKIAARKDLLDKHNSEV